MSRHVGISLNAAALLLIEAERRLAEWAHELAPRADAGDPEARRGYIAIIVALRALIPPERAPLLKTSEMAQRLGVAPKTIRALGKRGRLEAVRLGPKRGPAAIRWKTS
jgi:excisionase family DNA binding protein